MPTNLVTNPVAVAVPAVPPVVRWTLGPSSPATVRVSAVPVVPPVVSPTPTVPPKPDVVVVLAWDEVKQTANVTIPPYDPTVFSKLAEVRTYYLPSGRVQPADAAAWVASAYAFETSGDVSAIQVGATASLGVPAIGPAVSDPAGDYFLQTVLGFAE